MSVRLKKLQLAGWKSIKDATIELRRMNVLIGANGAGKSNLISFFKLIREMVEERLQVYIAKSGGANSLLFGGTKVTQQLIADLEFETDSSDKWLYSMRLRPGAADTLVLEYELSSCG